MELTIRADSATELAKKVKDISSLLNGTTKTVEFPPSLQQAIADVTPKVKKAAPVKPVEKEVEDKKVHDILVPQTPTVQATPSKPEQKYNLKDIQDITTQLIARKGPVDTKKLIVAFGGTRIGDLPPTNYDAYYAAAKKEMK